MNNLGWVLLNHWDATRHKFWVMWYILKACMVLFRRGLLHDLSKYSARETASFKDWTLATRGLTYGTEEYKRATARFAKDDEIHYSVNKHHPQYWPGGVKDMSPIDQLEMLCDWMAKSRKGIGIIASIKANAAKFNYDYSTQDGYTRDALEMKAYKRPTLKKYGHLKGVTFSRDEYTKERTIDTGGKALWVNVRKENN